MEKRQKHFFVRGMLIVVAILVVLSNSLNAQLANSPWPMFGHDERHTFSSPYKGPDSVKIGWMVDLGEGAICDPIIGTDGTIFVGTTNKLMAIDSAGSFKWEYPFPTTQYATPSPAISVDETIYLARRIGAWDRYLFAFNGSNGSVKWRYKISDVSDSSPVIGPDGTIFLGIADGKFIAINPNGTLKWEFNTGYSGYGKEINGSPALASDKTIYFGHGKAGYISGIEWFYALNYDGSLKWKFDLKQGPFSHPCLDKDGTLYCNGFYQLFALNPDGTIKWLYPWDITINAIGPDGTLYGDYYGSGDLLALNSESGSILWRIQSKGGLPTLDSDGTIYFVSDSAITALNSNGTVKWNSRFLAKLSYARPILGLKKDIYLSSGNKLYAFFEPSPPGNVDLVIDHFEIDPKFGTNVGANVKIGAIIKNIAGSNNAQCNVTFYVDNNPIGSVFVFVPPGMQAHTSKVIWQSQGSGTGEHSIHAYISNADPQESIVTNNESDTTYSLRIPIQQRINSISSGTIIVEPGTYYETITMKPNVTLKSQCGPDSTIIDGGSQSTIIDLPWWSDNMHIEGFTITNGTLGVDMDSPYNASVRRCRFINCGTGIRIYGIRGNNVVANNIIENNTIGIDGNNPKFEVINNTIVKNFEYGIKSIGANQPTPDIDNCILWGNKDDLGETAKAEYSCIEDADPGTGNIHDNPLFEDYDNANYHLQPNSPCIDRGNPDPKYNDHNESRNDIGAYGGPLGTKVEMYPINNLGIPLSYNLYQNYPNPFNPETTIKYQLPKYSEVTIKIYNIAGQLVKTLVDQKQPTGYYSANWNGKDKYGRDVASGLYFYNLKTNDFVQTRKMLLVR